MIYFANPCAEPRIIAAMSAGQLSYIDTPLQGNRRPSGVKWCADNGAFSDKWTPEVWWQWLSSRAGDPDCAFAVAPDVVADSGRTLTLFDEWEPKMRTLGYRVAMVAQDGLTPGATPWGRIDCLFIGGTTEWKLGTEARALVFEAKRRGVWVHMGRVNSRKRLRYAHAIGCDSADGTMLTHAPRQNLEKLRRWLSEIACDIPLWRGVESPRNGR